jgi:hypothetical protein
MAWLNVCVTCSCPTTSLKRCGPIFPRDDLVRHLRFKIYDLRIAGAIVVRAPQIVNQLGKALRNGCHPEPPCSTPGNETSCQFATGKAECSRSASQHFDPLASRPLPCRLQTGSTLQHPQHKISFLERLSVQAGSMRPQYRWSCLAAVALCAAVWLALYLAGYRIAHENGLMENQQALCLAVAALMFALAARGQSTRPDKLFCVSLMLFCFMFLLRELELKGERVPHWVQFILTSKPKKILLASCWLLLLIVALRHVRPIWQAFVRWLRTSGWLHHDQSAAFFMD